MPQQLIEPMPEQEIIFSASLITHEEKPALLLRKIYVSSEKIEEICSRVLRKGSFSFKGAIVFQNPYEARRKLVSSGLIPLNSEEGRSLRT